jgi:hypothetical protein
MLSPWRERAGERLDGRRRLIQPQLSFYHASFDAMKDAVRDFVKHGM